MTTTFYDPPEGAVVFPLIAIAAVGGAVLPRWSYGALAGAVVQSVTHTLMWGLPALSMMAAGDLFLWAGYALMYAQWLAMFTLVFLVRAPLRRLLAIRRLRSLAKPLPAGAAFNRDEATER